MFNYRLHPDFHLAHQHLAPETNIMANVLSNKFGFHVGIHYFFFVNQVNVCGANRGLVLYFVRWP